MSVWRDINGAARSDAGDAAQTAPPLAAHMRSSRLLRHRNISKMA